jgi:hypothetical protein
MRIRSVSVRSRTSRRLIASLALCIAAPTSRAEAQRSTASSHIAADTNDARAWFRRARALADSGRLDAALAAYRHAATAHFPQLPIELDEAKLFARRHEDSIALMHLRAAATLGFDTTLLDTVSAFASLRARPEYAALMRRADDARHPCRDVHTFDFFAGDFDAYAWSDTTRTLRGSMHNTRTLDGCVIVEEWHGATGSNGMSMSFYEHDRRTWRQVWSDDGNGENDFEGAFVDGAMRFHGWVLGPDGRHVLTRNTLMEASPGVIHHLYEVSYDNGKSWVIASDGRFVRRSPTASHSAPSVAGKVAIRP